MYPQIEPYMQSYVQVSSLHTIYYEESGNPDGIPVLFVHGGPGAGTAPSHRRYFDPARYRIVLVDQRGCGKSTPFCETKENTTQALIEDFELIRKTLGIDQWLLFGGSWGSLLSLAYAIKHPDVVAGLILRGVFLGREPEWDWLISPNGAARFFPDRFALLQKEVGISLAENGLEKLYQRLHESPKMQRQVSRAFARWEFSMLHLEEDPVVLEAMASEPVAQSVGCLEIHYGYHRFFLPSHHVLEHAQVLADIPITIVHGRYDMVCPLQSAWDLHQALPHSKLYIELAGHGGNEPAIARRLVAIMDDWSL